MALISSLCIFVLVAHFATPIVCHERHHQAALFVFGDSIFDPGNNKYINPNTNPQGSNNFPYGESFFKYPTGRASDGRLVPDFIAEYANLPFIPPYFEIGKEHFIHGVNFASAGSGCLAETNRGSVIDLKTQLKLFQNVTQLLKKKMGETESKQILSNAVYIFSPANNDFLFPFLANLTSPYSDTEYQQMVMGNLTSVLKGIYKEGGRKFVMFNVAPLGCVPSMRALNLQKGVTNGSCMEEATDKAKTFNSALPRMFKKLEKQLPGFKYTIFNFFKVFADSINNPTKYGFKISDTACCGTGPFRGILSCGGTMQGSNYFPYGESFFKHPTGRVSNGRLIPDFIAEYANLPFIPPYFEIGKKQLIHGVNFASAGSGCLAETSGAIVLKTQLKNFENVIQLLKRKMGKTESHKILANAVYIFSTGSNDMFASLVPNSTFPYSDREYLQMIMGNLTSVLKGVYKGGGRKFVMLNLGPLGCLPSTRVLNLRIGVKNGSCLEEATNKAKMFNSALPKMLKQLEKQLPGFKYTIFNFFKVFADSIHNPTKYGFKISETACCGTGPFRGILSCGGKRQVKEYELCKNVKDYLFFDSVHPSELAYQQYAALLWNGTTDVVAPHNLKSFFESSNSRCPSSLQFLLYMKNKQQCEI